ncbi:Hpt domain-containing protein [Pseudomonas sp.]|uniref:Hpt domain-containing protein n=1 Tax=Pseudomonas sp. TaxID=306 RepID=UPI00272C0C2C|nr:Hpt domain-containing protein [Pseudomonas sp.]
MNTDLPILDSEVQQALREMMRDDFDLLIDTFIADAQMRLGHLQASLLTQDWPAFAQTAHSFRGSCGNMGALAMQQACQEAEEASRAGDAEYASACLRRLNGLFDQVTVLLRPQSS